MLTNPLPDGKITVEGHLRIAGDGFEYADIYVLTNAQGHLGGVDAEGGPPQVGE